MSKTFAEATWLDSLALAPEDQVEVSVAVAEPDPMVSYEPTPETLNYAKFLADNPEVEPDYPDDIDAESPADPWMDRIRHEYPGVWPPGRAEVPGEAQAMADGYGGMAEYPWGEDPDSAFEDEQMEAAAARAGAQDVLDGTGDFPPLRQGLDDFPDMEVIEPDDAPPTPEEDAALDATVEDEAASIDESASVGIPEAFRQAEMWNDPAPVPLAEFQELHNFLSGAVAGPASLETDEDVAPAPQRPLTEEEDAELPAASRQAARAARRLRAETIGSRLSFTWMGISKVLTKAQIKQAAEVFEADSGSVSARKRLLNTRNAKFRVLGRVRHDIRAFWKETTLPFPETGVRLIRQDQVELFDRRMQALALRMAVAVGDLQAEMENLKAEARANLGELYNEADYPVNITALFGVEWSYPTVEPPDILMQLKPSVYKRELEKVRLQFAEAAQLAEDAFRSQMADVATRLVRQLRGNEDGSPKVIREAHVEKVNSFIERFKTLNVGSDAQMEALVADAEAAMQGIEAKALRSDPALRATLAESMGNIASAMDSMMADRPRRLITFDDHEDAAEATDTEGGDS